MLISSRTRPCDHSSTTDEHELFMRRTSTLLGHSIDLLISKRDHHIRIIIDSRRTERTSPISPRTILNKVLEMFPRLSAEEAA